ncbi:Pathogenesis-related protein PR-1 type [Trichinella spiralis]|uniref:Pathogenesis-related protein PR-1 type n=1 Tax=Trichinella spiralis TaxID=6334 RepID=A0ABR3KTR7_TRISP
MKILLHKMLKSSSSAYMKHRQCPNHICAFKLYVPSRRKLYVDKSRKQWQTHIRQQLKRNTLLWIAIKSQAARIIAGYCGTMTNCFLFFSALFALSQLSLQQGTPKPFNDLGKLMMVSVHNTVRGDATDQSNVQCLTNWDSTLESYAQGLANSCNRTAPANPPYGLAYSSEISEAIITPQSFVETLGNSFSLFYDPTTNQCDPADKTDCDTGRQIVWYQGDKVGCGRANCTGRDFVVCAYTFQSSLQTRPYSRDPLGPCANCPSDKTVCTARLCCIPDSDSSSTPSTSVTSCGEKPANLVNLVRFWSDALTQNYLVTSQSEISALSAQSRTSNLGAVGKIPLQTSTACPYLTPIYKLYAASATSNYYMIDSSLRQQRLTEGYTDQGVIGYAVPAQHLCNASVAIYEFYSPGNGIVQVAPSTAPGALAGQYTKLDYQGISFWIWE